MNGGGTEEHCLFFNSYHIHRGICIEGTSMHLNCLHDKWKAVLSSGKQKKRKYLKTYSHILTAHTHTGQKTPQASSPQNMRQVQSHPFKDKTAYSTPLYRESQRMAFTREERFQRRLAVKQQPGVSRVLWWEEAVPENTDSMIFTERSCSVPDQWFVENCPARQREALLLPEWERDSESALLRLVQSQHCSFSRRSDRKEMCRGQRCWTKKTPRPSTVRLIVKQTFNTAENPPSCLYSNCRWWLA